MPTKQMFNLGPDRKPGLWIQEVGISLDSVGKRNANGVMICGWSMPWEKRLVNILTFGGLFCVGSVEKI